MAPRLTRTLSSYFAFLLATPLALPAGEIQVLRGQLVAESRTAVQGLFVGMEDVTNHGDIHRVDVALDGSFEFRQVRSGDYLLRITNPAGQTVHEQQVTIYDHITELTVRLPGIGRTPSAPGTVSFRQLSHPPGKKAVQALTAASRMSSAGRYQEAIDKLEEAIRISPEFAGAYTNLAVQQIHLNRFEESAASSQRALEIGGPDPVNLCNLAYAQFQLHQFANAESSARAALRLDSEYDQAHLVLGSVLAISPATRAEAIPHLERAAERFSSARVTLDRLHKAR